LKSTIYLFIITLVVIHCNQKPEAEAGGSKGATGSLPFSAYEIATLDVHASAIRANAMVKSRNTYQIVAQQNAIVKDNFFSAGATVAQGALILSLDNTKELLALQKAKVRLKQAHIKYEEMLLTLKDSSFYVSNGNWHEVKERTLYKMDLPQAKVEYRQAQLALSQTKFYAPFTGVLANVWKGKGEAVQLGESLGFLYDMYSLVAEAKLIEYDYNKVMLSDTVVIGTMSQSSRKYHGKVIAKDGAINDQGFFKVHISLDQARGLVPGQNATATIQIQPTRCIAVPTKAIVNKSGKEVVFTYQSGLAKWNYITTGRTFDDQVEILEGLKEGDTVLTSNVFQLAHDSEVLLAGKNN
jgi:RND family efflux transporter MFP subunit